MIWLFFEGVYVETLYAVRVRVFVGALNVTITRSRLVGHDAVSNKVCTSFSDFSTGL